MTTKTDCLAASSSLLMLGIENLGNRKRSDTDKNAMRDNIRLLIEEALEKAFPRVTQGCAYQETENGIEFVIPAKVAKSELLTKFMPELESGIEAYNGHCRAAAVCRLRAVLHVAEDFSKTENITFAARLLASSFLRLFLMALPKERCVALLVSDDYYRHVVAVPKPLMNREFRRARIQSKEDVPVTVWAYHYPANDD